MRIEHTAAWVTDVERAAAFYVRWFGATPGPVYSSTRRPFRSVFLSFDEGARLELMASPEEAARSVHIALATGSREAVDRLFEQMRAAGVAAVSAPRETGDGYYEAVVADPDGNLVEITT